MQTVSHERRELRYDKKSGNVTHESLVTTATLGYDDEDEAEDADPSSCASNASIVQERRKVTYKVPQSGRESSRNKVHTLARSYICRNIGNSHSKRKIVLRLLEYSHF